MTLLYIEIVEFCSKQFTIKGGFNMKSTGIIRRVDELGRVVIPIELRNKFRNMRKGSN